MNSTSISNLSASREKPRGALSMTYSAQRPYPQTSNSTDTPPLRSFPRDGQRALYSSQPASSPFGFGGGGGTGSDDTRPSSVPAKGRRRESMGAQLRKAPQMALSPTSSSASIPNGVASPPSTTTSTAGTSTTFGNNGTSEYAPHYHPRASAVAIAAGAGGASARSLGGRRSSATPGLGLGASVGDLSASFGAAAQQMTSPMAAGVAASVPTAVPSAMPRDSVSGSSSAGERHTHFGAECFGPSSLDSSLPDVAPSAAALAQLKATAENHEAEGAANSSRVAPSIVSKDKDDHTVHRCEACAKVYRHPSCLIKHRWEHTVYWKEASKFLLSKHQQVQLLEAAAILVGMDSEATSLPEEKALWPAAVSPPSSGLLGSDTFNYNRLMEARVRRSTPSASTPAPSSVAARDRTGSLASRVATSPSASSAALAMSPTRQMEALQLVDSATPTAASSARTTTAAAATASGVPGSVPGSVGAVGMGIAPSSLPAWRSASRDSLATAVSSARMGTRTSKSPSPPDSDAVEDVPPAPREPEADNVFGDLDMDE